MASVARESPPWGHCLSPDKLLAAARACEPCLEMLLWGAASLGDRETVRGLIACGAKASWQVDDWDNDYVSHCLSPLATAAEEGCGMIVEELLAAGVDADTSLSAGERTPLMLASYNGHVNVVRQLIEAGAGLEAMGSDGHELGRATALQWASYMNEHSVVRELLGAGARLHVVDAEGWTALHLAAQTCSLEAAQVLVNASAEVSAATNAGMTPLHVAASAGDMRIVKLLLGAGARVDAADGDGRTPLHIATQLCNRDLVELLLAAGAEVDRPDSFDRTPLFEAALLGHRHVAEALVRAGADLDRLISIHTPYPDMVGISKLIWAARAGLAEVTRCLLDGGAHVDQADDSGKSPLSHAAYFGHCGVVKLLLDRGAEADRADVYGVTALHRACANARRGVAELLLAHGADVNRASNIGRTPLIAAATVDNRLACDWLVAKLIESGANVNACDEDGFTAIRCIAMNRWSRTSAGLLIHHGAALGGLTQLEVQRLHTRLAEQGAAQGQVLEKKDAELRALEAAVGAWCEEAAEHAEDREIILNQQRAVTPEGINPPPIPTPGSRNVLSQAE